MLGTSELKNELEMSEIFAILKIAAEVKETPQTAADASGEKQGRSARPKKKIDLEQRLKDLGLATIPEIVRPTKDMIDKIPNWRIKT